ncbi:MAG: DUF29 family protein [Acetobacteraceae bacterium]
MGDLYEEDILLWSERQAALLRRLAAGERVDDRDLDWPNIGEEIEAVGRSELRACEALLTQAVAHWLKQRCWPDSAEVPHWREKEIRFRQEAADAFSPSMRQRIDMARILRRARQRLPATIDGILPGSVPDPGTTDVAAWLAEA